jgi:hypothetical protein
MTPVPVTIAANNHRVAVTIPAAGKTLREVIRLAEPNWPHPPLTVMILGNVPNGTEEGADRGPFIVADPRLGQAIQATDYTIHGQVVRRGEDYTSPANGDLDSYVKAGVDTPAIAVLFW